MATFECEGYAIDGRTVLGPPDLCKVAVELETDGCVVVVTENRGPYANRALTPDGWLQLAGHARRLVDDANAAWASMGALGDGQGVGAA